MKATLPVIVLLTLFTGCSAPAMTQVQANLAKPVDCSTAAGYSNPDQRESPYLAGNRGWCRLDHPRWRGRAYVRGARRKGWRSAPANIIRNWMPKLRRFSRSAMVNRLSRSSAEEVLSARRNSIKIAIRSMSCCRCFGAAYWQLLLGCYWAKHTGITIHAVTFRLKASRY